MKRKLNLNVVNLPLGEEEWCDADERIFLACFEILSKFVESELGETSSKRDSHRGYRLHSTAECEKTAIDLYLWYKVELSLLEEEVNKDYVNRTKLYNFGHIDDIKSEKLAELMKIRRGLWT
mgnify:CR=1 FL=1